MEIEITPKLLAYLKNKAQNATKGNWFTTCSSKGDLIVSCVINDRYESRIANFEDTPYSERDAEYIAAANPAVMLALIARIEDLEVNKKMLE